MFRMSSYLLAVLTFNVPTEHKDSSIKLTLPRKANAAALGKRLNCPQLMFSNQIGGEIGGKIVEHACFAQLSISGCFCIASLRGAGKTDAKPETKLENNYAEDETKWSHAGVLD